MLSRRLRWSAFAVAWPRAVLSKMTQRLVVGGVERKVWARWVRSASV